ncbi:rhamnan synthesis F family protein [Caballeronia sordidicola]|nr:rhamnan synthesis F family protein [Caballeronia sordidicola]
MFYDPDGLVDDYITFKLKTLAEHSCELLVVANGQLTDEGRAKLESIGATVLVRKNEGFDVWAYREALLHVGWRRLGKYDEVILMNYTFYGPLFPWSEMFDEMQEGALDFWGISAHKAIASSFADGVALPYHIQSHFIAVRRKLLNSPYFRAYWEDMPEIKSYNDSVLLHESRFTAHFAKLGFIHSVYVKDEDSDSPYPIFHHVDTAIKNRCPILKRRVFFHNPVFMDLNAIDINKALDVIRATSTYDLSLIWKNITRTSVPRDLYTNTSGLHVLFPVSENSNEAVRTAALLHAIDADALLNRIDYIRSLPDNCALYVSTVSERETEKIRLAFDKLRFPNSCEFVTLPKGCDDMDAMLVQQRHVFGNGQYDLICKLVFESLRTKNENVEVYKQEHSLENLVSNRAHVNSIISLMMKAPDLGMLMPPLAHVAQFTLGHSWWGMNINCKYVATQLDIQVPFDSHTPLAPLGRMFWVRPAALRKIFARSWTNESLRVTAGESYKTMTALLERILAYCVLDAGYLAQCVLTPDQAEFNYTKLEYKAQRLTAYLPTGNIIDQLDQMELLSKLAAMIPAGTAKEKIAYLTGLVELREALITGGPPDDLLDSSEEPAQ